MILNENQHQALTDLMALKKINIFESLGCDAIPDEGDAVSKVFYAANLEKLEREISTAIVNNDSCALGQVMMSLFVAYNLEKINEKTQELQDEIMQSQNDLHGVNEFYLTKKHCEYGVDARDFF